jgi:hypothetical protein
MSHVGSLALDDAPQLPSRARQFMAIMLKNVLLQIRSQKVCGWRISGVFSIFLNVLVPVAFITAMCIVREIPDVDTFPRVFKEIPLRSADWEYPVLGAHHRKRVLCTDVLTHQESFATSIFQDRA